MPLQLREMDLPRDDGLKEQYPDGAWVPIETLEEGDSFTTGEPDGPWLGLAHSIRLGHTGLWLVGVHFMESEVVWWQLFTDDDRVFVTNRDFHD